MVELRFEARNGLFIVLEGIDGSGTTTQAQLLEQWIEQRGKKAFRTREPTGPIGDHIREILLDPKQGELEDTPWYFAAARAWHIRFVVGPKTFEGTHVISDRYYHSSLAYQSFDHPFEYVWELNKHFPTPDVTFHLDLPVETGLERVSTRGLKTTAYERQEFLEQVSKKYRLAMAFLKDKGHRCVTIDATRSIQDVGDQIRVHLQTLFDGRF